MLSALLAAAYQCRPSIAALIQKQRFGAWEDVALAVRMSSRRLWLHGHTFSLSLTASLELRWVRKFL